MKSYYDETENLHVLFGCDPDEVSDEDIEMVERKGWSVSSKGEPYCLYCGLTINCSIENMKNRKFCGVCRQKLN